MYFFAVVNTAHSWRNLCSLGTFDVRLRAAFNDTFEKSRFMMEMVSPNVDPRSAVEFDFR